jgi:UDP:flavonoid glycosyltransferase YjiC (YdhE family)
VDKFTGDGLIALFGAPVALEDHALSVAEAGDIPWVCLSPYPPPLRSPGVPPFGLGLRPLPGPLGRMRDAVVRTAVLNQVEKVMLPPINAIRAEVNLAVVASIDEYLRRAQLLMVAGGKPFQYPHTEWGDAVQMIGPCDLDPGPNIEPEWLSSIERPIVLVTSSSERQADADLVSTAIAALTDEPVHVVATLPSGPPDGAVMSSNATLCRFAPHGVILARAVCVVTHGGMGATQTALARGVPVCAVPLGGISSKLHGASRSPAAARDYRPRGCRRRDCANECEKR